MNRFLPPRNKIAVLFRSRRVERSQILVGRFHPPSCYWYASIILRAAAAVNWQFTFLELPTMAFAAWPLQGLVSQRINHRNAGAAEVQSPL